MPRRSASGYDLGMKRTTVGLAVACLTATSAFAQSTQIVTEMTAERIREAILIGTTRKEVAAFVSKGVASCDYTTPFLRVAKAANEAKRQYGTFSEADVTADMIEPVMRMHCFHNQVDGNRMGSGVADVQNVLIIPRGGGAPIRPLKSAQTEETFGNVLGAKGTAMGLDVTFPLAVISPENEVHVIYSRTIYPKPGGLGGSCNDCAMGFKMTGIR